MPRAGRLPAPRPARMAVVGAGPPGARLRPWPSLFAPASTGSGARSSRAATGSLSHDRQPAAVLSLTVLQRRQMLTVGWAPAPSALTRLARRRSTSSMSVAVGFLVVHSEVLDHGHLALALHTLDVGGRHRRVQVGILGVGLERPAPPRVAVDIHGRTEVDHRSLGVLLRSDDRAVVPGQRGVEGGRQGYGGRHLGHAGQAVTDADRTVLLANRGDAQARDRRDVEDVGSLNPAPVTMLILSASVICAMSMCTR
jgi:hypothetical protein